MAVIEILIDNEHVVCSALLAVVNDASINRMHKENAKPTNHGKLLDQ